MTGRRFAWLGVAVPLMLAVLALWQLERPRVGVTIENFSIGTTPATLYSTDPAGPLVVIVHGFAGSRQLMQAYALTLARAGYNALSFDFEGHGRNPVPMSGDVTAIDGTTQKLVDQTLQVVDAGLARLPYAGPVALLGHSMATDIIVRAAIRDPRIGPVVAISIFSQAVTPTMPADLLMITGQWEPGLRAFARDAVAMVDPATPVGATATRGDVRRRAVVAPHVEHVGVLYSQTALEAARDWLDTAYGRHSTTPVSAIGPWLLVLLGSIVALARPLSGLLPVRPQAAALSGRRFAVAIVIPAVVSPLIATQINTNFLPVLVADYLMIHLLIYGALQLGFLVWFRLPLGRVSPIAVLALAVWGIAVFGLALNRYGANFTPNAERLAIIAVLALGAVPFMVADALISGAGRAPFIRRLMARAAFFASLGGAVALDFQGLFFLVIIAPVILLFFLAFGLMGRWVGQRSGAISAGLALGLILAWSLGVSFPLFTSGGRGI